MNRYIGDFENYLKIEKDSSSHTIRNYLSDILQFEDFLNTGAACVNDTALLNLDQLSIRRYLSQLHGKNSRASVGRKLAALRTFYRFLLREGTISANPFEGIATPKTKKLLDQTNNKALALSDTS